MNCSQNLTLFLYLAACDVVILQEFFIFCEQVSLNGATPTAPTETQPAVAAPPTIAPTPIDRPVAVTLATKPNEKLPTNSKMLSMWSKFAAARPNPQIMAGINHPISPFLSMYLYGLFLA